MLLFVNIINDENILRPARKSLMLSIYGNKGATYGTFFALF